MNKFSNTCKQETQSTIHDSGQKILQHKYKFKTKISNPYKQLRQNLQFLLVQKMLQDKYKLKQRLVIHTNN
jgi:hypothetical protein